MKRIIATVIIAALVLAAFTVISTQNVSADSISEAKVLNNYSWYIVNQTSVNPVASPGDVIIVGEVQNVGSNIINNATVGGTALDANGTTLASATGQVFAYEMAPGQKAPFYIDLSPSSSVSGNQNWVSSLSSVSVVVTAVQDTTIQPYAGFTVPHDSIYSLNNDGNYTVVGTLQNNGTKPMAVWVVTTFYNAAGTVVAMNFTDFLMGSPVAPGSVTRFEAVPMDNTAQLSNEIASYAYVVDSESVTTQPIVTPTPAATTTPITSQLPWLPIAIGAVVIVVIVAVALMLLRKRQKTSLSTMSPLPPPPPPS